ncbi:hypothetical protein [Burkholderia sp. AU32262]|uniref:hypothetical protein n=1 Tax=Burkholderia sp. AU32262 TaxID=2879630 RepID=UPI001CF58447|nr:hypothetical protein [Burkholderia sp. AU32262]MCA8241859.1 hypothetical protein [Burkholderia sp. AU32262]
MITVALAVAVDRPDEEVVRAQPFEAVERIVATGQRIAQRRRHPVEHRRMQQEVADRVRHLRHHVLVHVRGDAGPRAANLFGHARRVAVVVQRQGRQLQARHPAFGRRAKAPDVFRIERLAGHPLEECARLRVVEAQVVLVHPHQLVARLEIAERQRGHRAARQHDMQVRRRVAQQIEHRVVDDRRREAIEVVEHQEQIDARAVQFVEQFVEYGLQRNQRAIAQQLPRASADAAGRVDDRGDHV